MSYRELRRTLYVSAPAVVTFLLLYAVMLQLLGYGYTLYVVSALVFTAFSLGYTILGQARSRPSPEARSRPSEPQGPRRFPTQATVSLLIVFVLAEELLLNSVYSLLGIILALVGFIAFPLVAFVIGRNDFWQRVAFETVSLLLATRLVVSPFPVGLLSLSVYVPVIYTLIVVGIASYVTYRKIPLEEIRASSGGKNPLLLGILGVAVGTPLGLIEYRVLSPGPVFVGAAFIQTVGYNILVLGLFVSIAEELLFRGLLLTSLEKRMEPWQAIGFSSIFFGVMHLGWFNPLEVFFAYGAGVVLAYLAYTTKSLTPAIAAHALDNFVLFLLAAHF